MDPGSLLLTVLQAGAGLAMLYYGGEALVRGSVTLALELGISRVAVGLTVVAFGTSAPELVVSMDAAFTDAVDIALGNVVGSNIANIALILGLSALAYAITIPRKIARLDLPLVAVASGWLFVALYDGTISRFEGALLLLGLVAYVLFTFWEARTYREMVDDVPPTTGRPRATWTNGALVVAGLLLLVGGGHLLVQAAVILATVMGVSQAAIGLTIVAVGTSLPELAACLVAAARGHGEIAVGNIVGSTMFNILGIAGATATVHPLTAAGLTSLDLGLMAALGLGLLAFAHTGRALARFEGAILLGIWIAYTIWLLSG